MRRRILIKNVWWIILILNKKAWNICLLFDNYYSLKYFLMQHLIPNFLFSNSSSFVKTFPLFQIIYLCCRFSFQTVFWFGEGSWKVFFWFLFLDWFILFLFFFICFGSIPFCVDVFFENMLFNVVSLIMYFKVWEKVQGFWVKDCWL